MYHGALVLPYIVLVSNRIVCKEVLYAQMGPAPAHMFRYPPHYTEYILLNVIH